MSYTLGASWFQETAATLQPETYSNDPWFSTPSWKRTPTTTTTTTITPTRPVTTTTPTRPSTSTTPAIDEPWPPVLPSTDNLVKYGVQKLQQLVGAPATGIYDTVTHKKLQAWAKQYGVPSSVVNPLVLEVQLLAAGLSKTDIGYAAAGWKNWNKMRKVKIGLLVVGLPVLAVVVWKGFKD